MQNPYEILGVDQNASQEEIKKSYRKQAMKWHPDRNPDNQEQAEAKMKEIVRAYYVLSDSKRRNSYNNNPSSSHEFYEDGFEEWYAEFQKTKDHKMVAGITGILFDIIFPKRMIKGTEVRNQAKSEITKAFSALIANSKKKEQKQQQNQK